MLVALKASLVEGGEAFVAGSPAIIAFLLRSVAIGWRPDVALMHLGVEIEVDSQRVKMFPPRLMAPPDPRARAGVIWKSRSIIMIQRFCIHPEMSGNGQP